MDAKLTAALNVVVAVKDVRMVVIVHVTQVAQPHVIKPAMDVKLLVKKDVLLVLDVRMFVQLLVTMVVLPPVKVLAQEIVLHLLSNRFK